MKSILTCLALSIPLMIAACRTETCVQPPPTLDSRDTEIVVSARGELPNKIVDAEAESSFKKQAIRTFDEISDSNATLYLWLNAIDCYLQRGDMGESIADRLADFLVQQYSDAQGWGGDGGLSPEVLSDIRGSEEYGEKILAALRSRGFDVE